MIVALFVLGKNEPSRAGTSGPARPPLPPPSDRRAAAGGGHGPWTPGPFACGLVVHWSLRVAAAMQPRRSNLPRSRRHAACQQAGAGRVVVRLSHGEESDMRSTMKAFGICLMGAGFAACGDTNRDDVQV